MEDNLIKDAAEKIYVASKTKHADKWKAFREQGYNIISTWIDEAGAGESNDLNDLQKRCISESIDCDLMIVYREQGDYLKGAFIEMGVALAHNKRIYLIGEVLPYGSAFTYNENVFSCATFEGAIIHYKNNLPKQFQSEQGYSLEDMIDCFVEGFHCTCDDKPLDDAAKEFIASLPKPQLEQKEVSQDFEKITGHKTPEEMTAYEKGREDEEKVFMKFIAEWDGKTNSHFGQAMFDTFKRQQKAARWVNPINEENRPAKFGKKVIVRSIDSGAVKLLQNMGHNQGWDTGIDYNFFWDNTEWLDESPAPTEEDIEAMAEKEYPSDGNIFTTGKYNAFIKGYKAALNNKQK